MKRGWSKLGLAAFLVLIGVSLWFRTTSLESMPDVDGDESWHAVQLTRMLRGEPYTLVTETGLPLSPIHAVMELPLLMAFGPTPAILRFPSILTGVLAIVLAYVLGSRVLDRTTATIAAGLIAVLPVATYCARTGYESSHAPLFTILLVYCAFRANAIGMSVLLLCSYFVHPTNIFILPALLSVMAARMLRESPDGAFPWRRFALKALSPTAIVGGIGLWTIQRPIIQKMSTAYGTGLNGRHDPVEFLTNYGRFFLGLGRGPWSGADTLFWATFSAVVVLGTCRLARDRRWDRLALVAGVLASTAAFFAVASSNILDPGRIRYGYFLMVPTALAFACLVRALLVTPGGAWWSGPARGLQVAALLAAGGALLMGHRLDIVDHARVVEHPERRGGESPWTFGSDREDCRKRAFSFVLDEVRRTGSGRGVIICTTMMLKSYLRLLALPHPNIEVLSYEDIGRDAGHLAMMKGAFAVYTPGPKLGDIERTFPTRWLKRWVIPGRDGLGSASVTRLADELPVAGDFDGDGRLDPVVFRRGDAHWVARLSGGATMDVAFGDHDLLEFPAPGDYDGDRKTDLGIFRPSTDDWTVRLASGLTGTVNFGVQKVVEIPVQADYDGDGKTDLAVFLPTPSTFAITSSMGAPVRVQQLGFPEHTDAAPADYDGDGKADPGVFIPENSMFSYLPSRGGGEVQEILGPPGRTIPAPGDFDGDGKAEIAVYLPDLSEVAYRPSKGGADVVRSFGMPGHSLFVPGDFDGDGKADLSVYIPASDVFAYRPSKGGPDVLRPGAARGGAEVAASSPPSRK